MSNLTADQIKQNLSNLEDENNEELWDVVDMYDGEDNSIEVYPTEKYLRLKKYWTEELRKLEPFTGAFSTGNEALDKIINQPYRKGSGFNFGSLIS